MGPARSVVWPPYTVTDDRGSVRGLGAVEGSGAQQLRSTASPPKRSPYILNYGRPQSPMPAWGAPGGGPLTSQQLEELILYLQEIQLAPDELAAGAVATAGHRDRPASLRGQPCGPMAVPREAERRHRTIAESTRVHQPTPTWPMRPEARRARVQQPGGRRAPTAAPVATPRVGRGTPTSSLSP